MENSHPQLAILTVLQEERNENSDTNTLPFIHAEVQSHARSKRRGTIHWPSIPDKQDMNDMNTDD